MLEYFTNKSELFQNFATGRTLVFQTNGMMRNAKITSIAVEDGSYDNFIVTLSVGLKLFVRYKGQIAEKLIVLK